MDALVSLDQAKGRTWDMIICGSSFAAMFFLRGLPRDLNVLIIEKGPLQPHERQVAEDFQGKETVTLRNSSGHEKEWVAHSIFGGNSNCW